MQFYVDFTCLRDHSAKHLYYLQLRENLREYRLLQSEEQVIQLVLYALQADFGPYSDHLLLGNVPNPATRRPPHRGAGDAAGALNGFDISAYSSNRQHTQNLKDSYFDPAKYFPQWVCLIEYLYLISRFNPKFKLRRIESTYSCLGSREHGLLCNQTKQDY